MSDYEADLLAVIEGLTTERNALAAQVVAVTEIGLGMRDLADHGAFIRDDPYEITARIEFALGIERAGQDET